MTLVLQALNQPDIQGERLWVSEVTSEYVVTTNEGGWGIAETPNPDKNVSCIVALARRNASAGIEELLPVGAQVYYNPSALNTDTVAFEFFYKNDGHHSIYLFRLPVSSDGDNSLDITPQSINEGDYYYHTVNTAVYQKVGGLPVAVTDLTDLIGNVTIQTLCEDFFQSGFAIERATRYLDMKATRKTNCAEDPKFQDLRGLTEDLISNDYTFRSGLTVDAQNMMEENLDEFNVDAVN